MSVFRRGWVLAPRLVGVLWLAAVAACTTTPTSPSPATNGGLTIGTAAQEPTSGPTAIIPNIPSQALGATRFLAFGDSITYGTVSSFDGSFLIHDEVGSYPRLLRSLLDANNIPAPFTVVNAGVPGETARLGVDRLPGVLTTYRPQVVMLLEGINDMNINNASPTQVATNVQTMVQIARLYNCTVLVATMPQTYSSQYPGESTPRTQSAEKIVPYNTELRRLLSNQLNVHIVDIYAAFGTDRSLMGNDGLHPTAAGYQRMAQTFHARIRDIFPVRGSLQ
jgi:acyl-CoA thioesterase I